MSAVSQILIFLFYRTGSFTGCTFSAVFWLMDDLSKNIFSRGHTALNLESHTETFVLNIVFSPKATLNALKVFIAFFSSSKPILM
jgi:hypothetical protein